MRSKYRKPIRWTFYYACRFLDANGPQPADMVGAVVWKDKKRGKTTSTGGGGDYAAQMLLGRMKAAGLVRRAPSEGCTLWEVTALGHNVLNALKVPPKPVTPETLTMRQIADVKRWATENGRKGLQADAIRCESFGGNQPLGAMRRICNHLNKTT